MNFTLVSNSTDNSNLLIKTITQAGQLVENNFFRKSQESLHSLLENQIGDILIVECLTEPQNDFKEIEKIIDSNRKLIVFVLCKLRDTSILLAAMQSGIREVLAYPTDENELREAIKRVEKRISTESKEKQINSKVISFISCKGGSGATFLATNFSYLLAEEFNQNTIFLDLDLQNGDAIYYVSPGTSKSDVIEITKQIDRLDDKLLASSVLHVSKNFDLLPSPEESDSINSMTPEALEKLINTSTKNYDIVVMDLERAMNTVTTQAIQMSNLVYIIMENLLPFIRDAKRLIQKLRDMGYSDQKIRLVVNRYENNGTIDIDQIESAVGIRVSHTIHSSFKEVAEAINTGVPIIKVNSNNTVVKNLRLMALEVTDGEKAKKTSWFNRLLGE